VLRAVTADNAAAAIGEWAQELEGFDDLHASPAMRRDLLRNLGPKVVAEAVRCAA
jgi:hypothetical protein